MTLVSIPLVFTEVYNFTLGQSGLVYICQFLGSTIGFGCDWYCNKLYLKNVAKKGPEARLYTAFVGGVCVPLGLSTSHTQAVPFRARADLSFSSLGAFIYCFTAYPQCHWMGTCVGITILCKSTCRSLSLRRAHRNRIRRTDVGMFCVYLSTFSYLGEFNRLFSHMNRTARTDSSLVDPAADSYALCSSAVIFESREPHRLTHLFFLRCILRSLSNVVRPQRCRGELSLASSCRVRTTS